MLMSLLTRSRKQTRHTARSRRYAVRTKYQPKFEALEDRFLLSTVTNLLDHGTGSLRDAIAAGGTVDFQAGLSGTISLASTLAVNKQVNIVGPGAGVITVSGQNTVEDFSVAANVNATISGLTIANGYAFEGGGISADFGSDLSLTDCVVSGNAVGGFTGGEGAGVFSRGMLELDGCTIAGNKTGDEGEGGGVWCSHGLTATNCTITNNSAAGDAGGIRIAGTATLTNCTISGNKSLGFGNQIGGGMIIVPGASTVNLINTIVAGNNAGTDPDIEGTVATADHCIIGSGTGN